MQVSFLVRSIKLISFTGHILRLNFICDPVQKLFFLPDAISVMSLLPTMTKIVLSVMLILKVKGARRPFAARTEETTGH